MNKRLTQPALFPLDEAAIAASLEYGPDPKCYYEIIYGSSEKDVPAHFPLKLFPAVRVLFKTDTYTIARVYIGRDLPSREQRKAMADVLIKCLFDYDLICPLIAGVTIGDVL
jgi:hypothetical protein